MKRPQKKEEFDKWYLESGGGDPWGCDSPYIVSRYETSLKFIRQFAPQDFDGVFVEMGAFNGDFTVRLAKAYPLSHTVANDISSVALDKARDRLGSSTRVSFVLSDMANFCLPAEFADRPAILLILESLYYMPGPDQGIALGHLLSEIRNAKTLIISGPMNRNGSDYFEESILRGWLEKLGLRFISAKAINTIDEFRSLNSFNDDWFISLLKSHEALFGSWTSRLMTMRISALNRREKAARARLDNDAAYRKRYAHQVIYCFQR